VAYCLDYLDISLTPFLHFRHEAEIFGPAHAINHGYPAKVMSSIA
jgi:hypothetical protein